MELSSILRFILRQLFLWRTEETSARGAEHPRQLGGLILETIVRLIKSFRNKCYQLQMKSKKRNKHSRLSKTQKKKSAGIHIAEDDRYNFINNILNPVPQADSLVQAAKKYLKIIEKINN